MKRIFLFSILLLTYTSWLAKKPEPLQLLNCSKVKGDYLWFSKTEVSNMSYREFLYFVQPKLSEKEFKALLPDTLAWNKVLGNSDPYINYYFRHPAYSQYPMVCITKKQAEEFCKFLTEVLNEKFHKDPNCTYQRIIVRLPTTEEWTYAAIGGLSPYNEYPWDGKDVLFTSGKYQGSARANFLKTNEAFEGVSGGAGASGNVDVFVPDKSYWPNGYGLYNMSGNAAEMVANEPIAMGGSFRDPHDQIKVTSSQSFKSASPLVGFRYVVEIQEFKPLVLKSKMDVTKKSFYKSSFVKLNDTLSIMNTEVSNELYNLFCQETKRNRPDSTLWKNQFYGSDQYVTHYNWHAKMRNFPVVNITPEDAEKFCFWLTQHYVRTYSIDAQIRLPKKEEMILAIEKGYEVKLVDGQERPSVFNGNIRTIDRTYSGDLKRYFNSIPYLDQDNITATGDVKASVSPKMKLYNLTSNVDEILLDHTVYLNRNWTTQTEDWKFTSTKINTASPTVGLRVVLVTK